MRVLERDAELAALLEAVRNATVGQGAGIAISGEGGAGKSTLVEAMLGAADGLRLLRGHCDPLTTPRPLGPFRDLWATRALPEPAVSHHGLLPDICEHVYASLRDEPTVLVVEDLHWADAATVEVLRFLARRVESLPLALVVSYRDEEIGPRHSARSLLGDFARHEGLATFPLAPLSVAAVAELLLGTGLDPTRVHELTGGNPFFAAEVAKTPWEAGGAVPLPESVRDAVLAHTAPVHPDDFEVLQLIACAPDRLDDRVLPVIGVDLPTLRRINATSLLKREEGGIAYRHELARRAVESTIPPGADPGFHARLLDALEALEPRDPAVLTHHAVAARDHRRAHRYARIAAEEAIDAGAHTEAAAFFETALDHLGDAPAADRAALLLALSFQQYMTSRLTEAIANVELTFPIWEGAGDVAGHSAAREAAALYQYYNSDRTRAEQEADHASSLAAGVEDQPALLGETRVLRAYLANLRSQGELARSLLEEARQIADREGDDTLAIRARVFVDATGLNFGEADARDRLAESTARARSAGLDELASTGYSNLANLDVEQARYRSAAQVLELSLPFTHERDIPICRHWQTGVRSRLNLAQGHWSAALEDAATVLETAGMPLATLWPLLVSGLVPLRRGESTDATFLDDAWSLASDLDEPVRWLSVLGAMAEWCWTTDQRDPRLAAAPVTALLDTTKDSSAIWAAGHLALWLRRLGTEVSVPGDVAAPHALALTGDARAASDWWRAAGDPFAEAMALADSADDEDRARAIKLLDRLGAVGTGDRLRLLMRRTGAAAVPQRPRTSTRANPAGLTNRQLDVAKQIARGLSNAEIGERLFISPKTVDHHVSAVLAKLDLPSRRDIVARAGDLGLA